MFLESPNCDTWEQANSEQPAAKALLENESQAFVTTKLHGILEA